MAVPEAYHEPIFKDFISHQNETVPSKLQNCVNTIVTEEEFLIYNVITKGIESDGGNYFGGLVSVDIKGETADGYKEIHVFLKLMKTDDQLTIFSIEDIFLREMFVYTELSKVFAEIQNEYNIPRNERYKLVRSFDRACSPDVIVLENMAKKGYTTPSRLEVVDLEYAKLAMKELAKLHGLSFALQEKKPEYFEKELRGLKYLHNFEQGWDAFIYDLSQMMYTCIDGDYKRRLEMFVPNITHKYRSYLEDDTRKCLCHFDFRPGNILMQKNNGRVTDLILIDYQLAYYGCPALDLIHFIYSCTDQQFRRQHMTELKAYYYECLGTYLKYYDVDVNIVYPRGEFENHFANKHDFGLIVAIVILTLTLTIDNNAIDITNPAKKQVKFDDTFYERMTDILDDFIEMGLL